MERKTQIHEVAPTIFACEAYIIHNNKVLMHQRPKDKKVFPGYWIAPGGHIDAGDDALGAVIREIKEETTITLSPDWIKLKVLAFHHHTDRNEVWIEYLFNATIPTDQPITAHEGKLQWIEKETVMTKDDVFPLSQIYFDHILNDKPGILYRYCECKNAQLVKIVSEHIGH